MTELKHYFHKANLHVSNPPLFKAVNDLANESDFKASWTLDQMTDFFMNQSYLDISGPKSQRVLPTLDQLVLLFESLDTQKNGYLSAEDMRLFIDNIDKLKRVDFDLDRFVQEL